MSGRSGRVCQRTMCLIVRLACAALLGSVASGCERGEPSGEGVSSANPGGGAAASAMMPPTASGSSQLPTVPVDLAELMKGAVDGPAGAEGLGRAALARDINHIALTQQLKPRDEDYSRVFVEAAAAKAKAAYSAGWDTVPIIRPWSVHDKVRAHTAKPEQFQPQGKVLTGFPPGYADVASLLKPGVTWYALEFAGDQAPRPIIFDGLVYLGDHWAYFPKPHRFLL